MKKSLLVIMMSMVMGGLVASPRTTISAKAEAEKLKKPNEVVSKWNGNQGFHGNGELEIPWEYLTDDKTYGTAVKNLATLELAFFPVDEEFNEEKSYATLIREAEGNVSSSSIVSALKSSWVDPDVAYSVALRYVSKTEEYTNSDWSVPLKDAIDSGEEMTEELKAKYSHQYEFDYKLNRYELKSFGTADNGDLKYAWEILTGANPEHDEIDHLEVLVYDGNIYDNSDNAPEGAIKSVDETVKPLTTFNVVEGENTITKNKIQGYLTAANLKPGKYSFSARIIAKETSNFENSDLYPLSPAREYEPELLSSINIAKKTDLYVSCEGDPKSIVDGNPASRFTINPDSNGRGWLIVDLGAKYYLSSMKVSWERARAADYDVYIEKDIDVVSFNEDMLKTMKPVDGVYNVTDPGKDTADEFELENISGRYIILSFLKAATGWGYSIYEVEVYQNADLPESEKFINDWKDLRALGNGDICNVKDSEEMARMLEWYANLSEEDKAIVDSTDDAMGVTIGDTIRYLNSLNDVDSDLEKGANLVSNVIKNENSMIGLIAFASICAVAVAYYFINKKKYSSN